MGPIERGVPKASLVQPKHALDDGYDEVVGVIHIHTTYSDGFGTYEDIARVANRQQLDYLVVTDHNTLKPLREGKQGWHGMTLVLVGTEISTRAGHFLALNVHDEISKHQPTQAIIDVVRRQGGLGFIAHPYFKKRRWSDWTVRGFTGIEGYNVAHDSFDENPLRLLAWGVALPSEAVFLSIVKRPYDPLAKWDELIRRDGRFVGIGASDAHGLRIAGIPVAPYEVMFKMARTHVLLPRGVTLSPEAFYEALKLGHAYFSIDLVMDARGFSFMADDGARMHGVMGDEVALAPGLELTALLPAPAELALFKDGRSIATTTGQAWHVSVREPGVYRLEASRFNKPWIFSNPIYVRVPKEPEINTQHSALSNQH